MVRKGEAITLETGRPSRPSTKEQIRPNPVDAHVGSRVRLRRTFLGISQTKLGDAVGLSCDNMQDFERGALRSASQLWELARALQCSVSFFFEEMEDNIADVKPGGLARESDDIILRDSDPLTKRETFELVRSYYQIDDYNVRRRIYELAKALASTRDEGRF